MWGHSLTRGSPQTVLWWSVPADESVLRSWWCTGDDIDKIRKQTWFLCTLYKQVNCLVSPSSMRRNLRPFLQFFTSDLSILLPFPYHYSFLFIHHISLHCLLLFLISGLSRKSRSRLGWVIGVTRIISGLTCTPLILRGDVHNGTDVITTSNPWLVIWVSGVTQNKTVYTYDKWNKFQLCTFWLTLEVMKEEWRFERAFKPRT